VAGEFLLRGPPPDQHSNAGTRGQWYRLAADGALNLRAIAVRPFNYRNGFKPVRTSSVKDCGCSQAAKCPPLSSLL
jgi:hypothetical protein